MAELQIAEWDGQILLDTIRNQEGFRACILASANCGKTTLVKHLYQTLLKPKFNVTIVFTNEPYTEAIYNSIGVSKVYTEYDEIPIVDKVMREYNKVRVDQKTLFIFDGPDTGSLADSDRFLEFTQSCCQYNCSILITATNVDFCSHGDFEFIYIGYQQANMVEYMTRAYLLDHEQHDCTKAIHKNHVATMKQSLKYYTANYGFIVVEEDPVDGKKRLKTMRVAELR